MALQPATAQTAQAIKDALTAKGAVRQQSYGITLPEGVYAAKVGVNPEDLEKDGFSIDSIVPVVDYVKDGKTYFMQLLSLIVEAPDKIHYLNVSIEDNQVNKFNVGESVSIEVKPDKNKIMRAAITSKKVVALDADLGTKETPEAELERLETEIKGLKGAANKAAKATMQARIDELEEILEAAK